MGIPLRVLERLWNCHFGRRAKWRHAWAACGPTYSNRKDPDEIGCSRKRSSKHGLKIVSAEIPHTHQWHFRTDVPIIVTRRNDIADILETLLAVKTMEEADVKAKFGTSASNVRKVLKALLMEQMAEEKSSWKEKATKKPKKADVKPSIDSSPSGENSPAK